MKIFKWIWIIFHILLGLLTHAVFVLVKRYSIYLKRERPRDLIETIAMHYVLLYDLLKEKCHDILKSEDELFVISAFMTNVGAVTKKAISFDDVRGFLAYAKEGKCSLDGVNFFKHDDAEEGKKKIMLNMIVQTAAVYLNNDKHSHLFSPKEIVEEVVRRKKHIFEMINLTREKARHDKNFKGYNYALECVNSGIKSKMFVKLRKDLGFVDKEPDAVG